MVKERVVEIVTLEILKRNKMAKLLESNNNELAEYQKEVAEAFSEVLKCYQRMDVI